MAQWTNGQTIRAGNRPAACARSALGMVFLLCAAACPADGARFAPVPSQEATVAGTQLQNPGFEADPPAQGWSLHVYGPAPQVEADRDGPHAGRQALRVTSTEAADIALGQELALKPGRWYRFTGWVRTRGLAPQGAPVYGTYQIQQPGGRGVIATGAPHGGDTDWTPVPILFRAPPGGRTRVAVFFAGYGRGVGTAWFDDMKIEEVEVSKRALVVTRRPACPGTISPLQYGQFIEYLCNLVPGMWAEKLCDGSFEGLTPYAFVFIQETDNREKPWYPGGAVNRAQFARDEEDPVGGKFAQKIQVEDGAPATVSLSQDGIAVRRAVACDFTGYFRQKGVTGPVTIRLHAGGRTLAKAEVRPGERWEKACVRLRPAADAASATFTVAFRGPGTLWMDSLSLMPDDAVGGWRRDVVEALRALKPGVVRFGGSVVDYPAYGDYEWRKTLGDPDRRAPFRSWGGLQPPGAGLEELVQLMQAAGAEPLLCVRFIGSTPEEAAAQVEYFNGAPDTPMGARRAANGRREPYRIRYWQVGNEVQSADYDARMADFCHAMKAADPTINLLSSYPTPAVLESAGSLLDYVCPHHYGCADLEAMQRNVEEIRQMIRLHAPGRAIKVAVTEWNTTAGDWGPARAMLWTLSNALACARYHNLMHRNADIIEIANRSNLTNSFCSGILQTDNHRLYMTPTYYAQQLYATLAGTRPLQVVDGAVEGDGETVPVTGFAGLDVSATLSEDDGTLTLFVVNDGAEDETRTLDLAAFGRLEGRATAWTLADTLRAGEPDVTNSFDAPRRVVPRRSTLNTRGTRFSYRFPALSLTVLQWAVAADR